MGTTFYGKFSCKANLQSFPSYIFKDAIVHTHYTQYNRAYFVVSHLSAKTAKLGSLENSCYMVYMYLYYDEATEKQLEVSHTLGCTKYTLAA